MATDGDGGASSMATSVVCLGNGVRDMTRESRGAATISSQIGRWWRRFDLGRDEGAHRIRRGPMAGL